MFVTLLLSLLPLTSMSFTAGVSVVRKDGAV